jgi:hypothetical protein
LNITIIADISSRIAQEKHNADRITAGAVCLPSGALRHIRKQLPRDLAKWRDANDTDVRLVSDIVLREALGVAVYSIEKSLDKWDQFWADASSLNSEMRGKIGAIKAAYQIKCLIYVKSTTLACASAVRTGNVVRASTRQHGITTRETLIVDKEIDGTDNIEVFRNIWHRSNAGQPLTETLGIKRTFDDIKFVTEQEDRLLMLPDYVAGIAHAANSKANVLAASKVSPECVQSTQRRFEQTPRYVLVCEPFSLTLSEILGA